MFLITEYEFYISLMLLLIEVKTKKLVSNEIVFKSIINYVMLKVLKYYFMMYSVYVFWKNYH